MTAKPDADDPVAFLKVLKKGVRDVISDKDSTPGERVAAINAGVKIAMVVHKISGADEDSFFK